MQPSLLEVRELLKRFSIIIYTGNQVDDATLMEMELEDLWDMKLIDEQEYLRAKLLIKRVLGTQ